MIIRTTDKSSYSSYEIFADIFETGEQVSIIVICSYCTNITKNSCILGENCFTALLDDCILLLNLSDMSYKVKKIKNPFGTYCDIYRWESGYILYGELEILMLKEDFSECWRYCPQEILTNPERKPLIIENGTITFYDWSGSRHQLDRNGKLLEYREHKRTVTLDVSNIRTPKEFQQVLKVGLNMPDFYGMNWNAFWDGITGLTEMPSEIILNGWHKYKSRQKEDAMIFERIMKEYNQLHWCNHCECIYLFWE